MISNRQIDKEIIQIALPLLFSNIVVNLSGFIGAVILAKLGATILSATALIYSLMGLLVIMAFGMIIPITILVAQMSGSNRLDQVRSIFQNGLLLVLILGFVSGLLMWNSQVLLLWFKQPPEVSYFVSQYFSVFIYAFFPMLMTLAINQLLVGLGHVKACFVFTALSALLNLLLMYCLVDFHLLHFTIGIEGAAYASLITYIVILMLQIIFIHKHAVLNTLGLFQWSGSFAYFKPLLKLGIPITIQRTMELLALSVMTFFMGWLGETALAAQQITMQVAMILLIVPYSFIQAAGMLIGRAYGQKNLLLVKKYMLRLNVFSSLIMVSISSVILLIPGVIIHWFSKSSDTQLFALSLFILHVCLMTQLFDNLRNVTIGGLRGLNDSKIPMLQSMICMWCIAVPLCYWLAFNLHYGARGVAIGWAIGIAIGALWSISRFRKVTRKLQI